jgi:hypothetical protein
MEHSPWEAGSENQEIFRFLCNPNGHYRFHKKPRLGPSPELDKSAQKHPILFSKINVNHHHLFFFKD